MGQHLQVQCRVAAEGPVLVQTVNVDNLAPYYFKDGSPEKFNDAYWMVRVATSNPPIRAGGGQGARGQKG